MMNDMEISDKLAWGMAYYFVTLVVCWAGYGGVQYFTQSTPVVVEKIVIKEVEHVERQVVIIPVVTTGYCPIWPCVSKKWADGRTATGKLVRIGHCAADWTFFPPGTEFFVPGYGSCVVEDSGRLVKGRHLDLYFHTAEEARQWGRRMIDVQLVRWGRV